jgi:hypothetical protein
MLSVNDIRTNNYRFLFLPTLFTCRTSHLPRRVSYKDNSPQNHAASYRKKDKSYKIHVNTLLIIGCILLLVASYEGVNVVWVQV